MDTFGGHGGISRTNPRGSFSLIGSTMIGLSGIFPLLIIPIEEGANLKTGDSAGTLKVLLSFAVGGLFGRRLPPPFAGSMGEQFDAKSERRWTSVDELWHVGT